MKYAIAIIVLFFGMNSILLFTGSKFMKVEAGQYIKLFREIDVDSSCCSECLDSDVCWSKKFRHADASFIAIHFKKFRLSAGHYVEVSSPRDPNLCYRYIGKGKEVDGGKRRISDFWSAHIPGDSAVVTLYKNGNVSKSIFSIDMYSAGTEYYNIKKILNEKRKKIVKGTICEGVDRDEKEWIACYKRTCMYNRSRALCRMLIEARWVCTGWLLGSEGHVMTCSHNIWNDDHIYNIDFEFLAEGTACNYNCKKMSSCSGFVEADNCVIVKRNGKLDYLLLKLPSNPSCKYGFLQLKNSAPEIGERIYIPQHPVGWGKQISIYSDIDGPYAKIVNIDGNPCVEGEERMILYYADVDGGSSGSPVISYSDHTVIALHYCSNCPQGGSSSQKIIKNLGDQIPLEAIAVCSKK